MSPLPFAYFHRIALAGFLATAVTFGPGRMGFGLFLPDLRDAFSLSSAGAGFISGLGFFAFFLALPLAYVMTARGGPRLPVALGLGLAGAGMALVAGADWVGGLGLGVCLSMASAGMTWAPFNTAVERALAHGERAPALAIVTTGTTIGVAAAGAAALGVAMSGIGWRGAWTGFAGAAFLAGLAALTLLRDLPQGARDLLPPGWRGIGGRAAWPVYLAAFGFGITTAVYISFGVDHVAQSGGLPGLPGALSAPVIYLAYGICGLLGLTTARLLRWAGLARSLRILFGLSAVSHLAIGVMPLGWAAVLSSAGLQGAFVMMMSAVFAVWTERLFPGLPALGFTAALMVLGMGSVLGPVGAGMVADAVGFGPIFMVCAALSVAMALHPATARVTDRPAMSAPPP